MIHQIRSGYLISSHAVWLPGLYDSKKAATYAFRLPEPILQQLTDRICSLSGENRAISFADLKAAALKLKEQPHD